MKIREFLFKNPQKIFLLVLKCKQKEHVHNLNRRWARMVLKPSLYIFLYIHIYTKTTVEHITCIFKVCLYTYKQQQQNIYNKQQVCLKIKILKPPVKQLPKGTNILFKSQFANLVIVTPLILWKNRAVWKNFSYFLFLVLFFLCLVFSFSFKVWFNASAELYKVY